MGYLMLGIALLAGAAKSYCGKRTAGLLTESRDGILATLVRLIIAAAVGLILLLISETPASLVPESTTLWVAAAAGVATAFNLLMWLLYNKDGSYLLREIFARFSLLIPLLGGRILYGDRILPIQWFGFILLLGAVLLLRGGDGNEQKKPLTPRLIVYLVVNTIAYGFSSLLLKVFANLSESGAVSDSTAVFNFYTYLFAAVTLTVCLGVLALTKRIRPDSEEPEREPGASRRLILRLMPFISVMAVGIYVNSYFMVQAGRYLTPVQIYPFNSGASLVITALLSTLFFKEKLTWRTCAGIILAFAALMIINVLPLYLTS